MPILASDIGMILGSESLGTPDVHQEAVFAGRRQPFGRFHPFAEGDNAEFMGQQIILRRVRVLQDHGPMVVVHSRRQRLAAAHLLDAR